MKWLLQICLFIGATLLFLDSPAPVNAQNYYQSSSRYVSKQPYRTSYSNRQRRIKRARRNAARKKARAARIRTARIGHLRRKSKRNRARARSRNRNPARTTKRKLTSRQLASLNKKKAKRKKSKLKAYKKLDTKAGKGPVQIVISLPTQRVRIYKGGKVIASSRVSTGKSGHRTPPGVFSIIQKNKRHYSNLYNSAPMPYMQRITWSGLALHAGNVSRPYASHGCVRMPYGFAKKLFKRTRMGAHVIVASSPSSLAPITHDNLLQPTPAGVLLANSSTQTAALVDPLKAEEGGNPVLSLGGLPGFVKPVAAAKKQFAGRQQALEEMIEAGPSYVASLEGAKIQLEARKAALGSARKTAVITQKPLRKPRLTIKKIKRKLAVRARKLAKAEGRARWAWSMVDKRREKPGLAGKRLKAAMDRAAARDLVVVSAKTRVNEATDQLDAVTKEYDALREADRTARNNVAARTLEVKAASLQVKKARNELEAGKLAVNKAKKDVARARSAIKSAIAREKLPLRILITPRQGRERIKDTQKRLAELGYEPGPIDGVVGSRTRLAVRSFQRELGQKETGEVTDKLVTDLYARVGRTQTANAHMYVRQGFIDLFDVPVGIQQPAKALGTHVFTAMHFEANATRTDWTALTVKDAGARKKAKRIRKRTKRSRRIAKATPRVTAREALDRISIPGPAKRQLAMLLTPGSSMVISDNGMSHETGKGTDFVVLTK